jgi:hypothetical protein
MKTRTPFALALLFATPALWAADNIAILEAESAAVDNYAVGHSSTVENRISGTFTEFSGSSDNASALVGGLRQGTPVNLTSTAPDGTVEITSFSPATGPMGYGNVRTSLALAQHQLATLGVTNPTPEQIAAALNGGSIAYVAPDGTVTTTTLKGVLEMRAAGQGWGEIAQAYGTKLGPVISGLKATRVPAGATATTTAGMTTSSPRTSAKGLTQASPGSSAPKSSGASHGNAYGKGIVTAYGVGANGVVDSNPGKGHANGASAKATTVTNTSSGAGGASTGGVSTAHGGGNAYGHSKTHGKN